MSLPRNSIRRPFLRAMTWNIHKAVGGKDLRCDIDRVVRVIREHDPDVALLQEVAQGIPRLGGADQVEQLAKALDYRLSFHPEHQFRRGGYGNLILSRWPLRESTHLDLTIGRRKRRGALWARTVVSRQGYELSMVLVNLHLGLAGRERADQLQRLLRSPEFRSVPVSTAVVLGGDLNDVWSHLGRVHLLPEGFVRAGRVHMTFPAALPFRALDGLYVRGGLRSLGSDVGRSRLARAASDHLPLYADLELGETATGR